MRAPESNPIARLFNSRSLNLHIGLPIIAGFSLLSCSAAPSASPDNTGKTITILSQFADADQAKFEQSLAPFEAESGIDIIYDTTDNFNSLLKMRIASFNAPDMAVVNQPGLVAEFAEQDMLVPLTDLVDIHALREAYSDTWLDLSTSIDDELYTLWYRASVKSLIWYRPSAFEAKGYDIPDTWAELMALSDKIVLDGETPWCIGLESGAATGWPGTDWIEDILLRTAGPETYRQWIDHNIPFDAAPVVNAFNQFGKLLKNDQYVAGGSERAIATSYETSPLGIFNQPPNCYLHRQGSFVASFFPEDKTPRIDYDVFLMPPIDEKFGTPLLVAGDGLVAFNNTPQTQALMQYLTTPEPHEIWAGLGGFISASKELTPEDYPDPVAQNIAQVLSDAEVIRFDASDAMPSHVGTDLFWSGMVDFAKGKSAEEVTAEIEQNW